MHNASMCESTLLETTHEESEKQAEIKKHYHHKLDAPTNGLVNVVWSVFIFIRTGQKDKHARASH